MASSIASSVVEYDFVEKPSEEYFCPVTLELLTDPVQTNSCCGNHLSRAVAEKLRAEGKSCPICKKWPLKPTDDRFFKRKVMELKVYCNNKSAGCEWKGELGELDHHLNLGSVKGQCDFVEVDCPLKCGQSLQRCDFEKHCNDCVKQPLCKCKAIYEIIVNGHMSTCQYYQSICPNNCCTNSIERRFLKRHLEEECPLEEIKCDFSFAGCQATVKRQRMSSHLDESKDAHLKMTASKCKELEDSNS